MFAESIEPPLATTVAVADDGGLRLLPFTDRRAFERELGILRTQLAKYFAGENFEFKLSRAPAGGLSSNDHAVHGVLDPIWRRRAHIVNGGAPRHRRLTLRRTRNSERRIGKAELPSGRAIGALQRKDAPSLRVCKLGAF